MANNITLFVKTAKTNKYYARVSYPGHYSLTGFTCDLLQRDHKLIGDGILEITDISNESNRKVLLKGTVEDWGNHQSDLVKDFFKGITCIEVSEHK